MVLFESVPLGPLTNPATVSAFYRGWHGPFHCSTRLYVENLPCTAAERPAGLRNQHPLFVHLCVSKVPFFVHCLMLCFPGNSDNKVNWIEAPGLLSTVFGTVMVFAILHIVEKLSLAWKWHTMFYWILCLFSLKLLVQRPELI